MMNVPLEWARGQNFPIFKGGPEDYRYDPMKYRGITLLSILGKIYTSIIKERLTKWCEKKKISQKNKVDLEEKEVQLIKFLFYQKLLHVEDQSLRFAVLLISKRHMIKFGELPFGKNQTNMESEAKCGESLKIFMKSRKLCTSR